MIYFLYVVALLIVIGGLATVVDLFHTLIGR